jgi:hypothetical protein
VPSSRAAISVSVSPQAASNTSLARITFRYGREYCPPGALQLRYHRSHWLPIA